MNSNISPFEKHGSSMLETEVGIFVDNPDQKTVFWQTKQCKAVEELQPDAAAAIINLCDSVKPVFLD